MADVPKNKTLVVIAGPTAVGKTAMALHVAKYFGAEIVSADSRQIFRELTIGTAKPSNADLLEVRHHFVNTHSIHDEYDAAAYGVDALARIHQLFEKDHVVVLCGGSGLYLKAVLEGFDDIPEISPSVRQALIEQYERSGLSWLQKQMRELDPAHYEKLDSQNPHRLIRALEVKLGTGFSIGYFQEKRAPYQHPFRIIKIGLELPREETYQRIDTRMDQMISEGLFTEAESLYPLRHLQALQTVGYQEIFGYLAGEYDKEEAIRLLKRNTRRYAKRQLTWFKKDKEMKWFSPLAKTELIQFITESMKAAE